MVSRAAKISTGIDLESTPIDYRNRTRPSTRGRLDALRTAASRRRWTALFPLIALIAA